MASRYINASDLGKLLGKKYGFFWTSDSDIERIIFNKKIEPEIKKILNELPEEILYQTLDTLGIPKKRKIEENKESVLNSINDTKKKITDEDFIEYKSSACDYLNTLPNVLKKAVDTEFTLEYGKVQESKIIEEFSIKKTNKLHYLDFSVNKIKYKIGCRFDGPQIEIKTRKNKFLGVTHYEYAQITVYMAVAKKKTWALKEKWNDKINDHQVFFDESFFEKLKNDIHNSWEYYNNK